MIFNIPEFTVSEFSRSIKYMIEDAFGYVRIKGEISGFKKASSGHLYFSLKDGNALLSAVCFRGSASSIDFEIGDGLQVCAFGKVTTYEGRSNYQIIVEKVEIAGVGAILEMLEKRRKKFLSEGLFDKIHKKPVPFFPRIIGVITSQTGAVIEDIKDRIKERCPAHIMLYPALVQGKNAAAEIVSGIRFFNKLKQNCPEIIIIARGGGSFEDLLCFSDEDLIYEVFKSRIPIVSAVGHETDTTLIDYVSDIRASTPTAAAELVTPVLADLRSKVEFLHYRTKSSLQTFIEQKLYYLKNLERYLVSPEQILERAYKKLKGLRGFGNAIFSKVELERNKIDFIFNQQQLVVQNKIKERRVVLKNLKSILELNHYHKVLMRGFALIRSEKDELIFSISEAKKQDKITVEMSDGKAQFLKTKS